MLIGHLRYVLLVCPNEIEIFTPEIKIHTYLSLIRTLFLGPKSVHIRGIHYTVLTDTYLNQVRTVLCIAT